MSKFQRGVALAVASVLASAMFIPDLPAAAAGTSASAVRTLVVADAWNASNPRVAQAKLTWAKPTSTYGYSVVGYRIEKSFDKSSWTTVISNTNSTATTRTISSGLKIGVANYFRVKAVTKRGSTTAIGLSSNVFGKALTAMPVRPILLGLDELVALQDSYTPFWLKQSASAAGSIKPTYIAVAKSAGETVAQCQTSTNSCELSGLTPGSEYKISVTVKNSRGQATNLEAIQPTDESFDLQWYLNGANGISATRAWTATRGSSKVVVAVLDSGITYHPDLVDQLVSGYDFVSNTTKSGDGNGIDKNPADPGDWDKECFDSNPGDTADCVSSSWHGTHVAGIIAAKQNSVGISGVAPGVKIQPIRVLGQKGEGSAIDLAIAIMWAAGYSGAEITQALNASSYFTSAIAKSLSTIPTNATPARVINMSMAGPGNCPGVVGVAIQLAQDKGAVLVAAAGNGDENMVPQSNQDFYPTSCRGPISVGATDSTGDAARYSNYGVDLSAPGGYGTARNRSGMIFSTSNNGETSAGDAVYKYEMGTSMAAPVVSGILALMISLRPYATYDELTTALIESALPFSESSSCVSSGNCGAGIANAANALRALISITG